LKTKVPIKQRPRGEREGEPRGESEGERREGGWRLGFFIKAWERERERGERGAGG
jgi:hypothetical protein